MYVFICGVDGNVVCDATRGIPWRKKEREIMRKHKMMTLEEIHQDAVHEGFEIGDRVQFALGTGPVMLITSRNEDGTWVCQWWSNEKDCFKSECFEDGELIIVVEPK